MKTIAVTWGGRDVVVELRPVGFGASGRLADLIHLAQYTTLPQEEWSATLHVPKGMQVGRFEQLEGDGTSAQEAVDGLAAQLRGIADWATAALKAPGGGA